MSREVDALAKATAMLVAEQRDALMKATVDFVGEARREIAAEIAGVSGVAAAAAANAVAAVAPAVTAAEARKAALLRRRKDTLEVVGGWLGRCADDA